MREKIKEIINKLGECSITEEEWKKMKIVVDNRFYKIKSQSVFSVDKNTLTEIDNLFN